VGLKSPGAGGHHHHLLGHLLRENSGATSYGESSLMLDEGDAYDQVRRGQGQ
jgi:hypothetical protein